MKCSATCSLRCGFSAGAIVVGVLCSALEGRSLAGPDTLKLLLEQTQGCKQWREVSQVTRELLRESNATGAPTDLKLVEQAFSLIDACAEELENRLNHQIMIVGLAGEEESARRAARAYAALFAYYRQALPATEKATALKSWPYLAQAANTAFSNLKTIVDRRFGEGAFDRYMAITNKPEQSRTDAEKKTLAEMHSWLEPL